MKCTIPGNNVKVFGRAIHSLSKIGEELYVEPLEHGLTLRTVNSSRSAYACFVFAPDFFQHYDDGSGEINSQDSEDDGLKCKITMKSCLTVFKSLSTIEKTVERCKISLDMKEARLVFQHHCRHGIVKTHNLAFIECETLQAVFSKDGCANSLTANPRLLADVVANFQTSQEEVTLIVSRDKISFKNYVEDEPDSKKVMNTELNLDPDEFDSCSIGTDTNVTFCLKELRAILAFGEVTSLSVSIHFDTSGKPIVFTIAGDKAFEANFVLATLADLSSQSTASQQKTASQAAKNMSSTITELPSHVANTSTKRVNGTTSHAENGSGERAQRKATSARFEAAYQDLMDDNMDFALNAAVEKDVIMEMEAHHKASEPISGNSSARPSTCEDHCASPVIPNQGLRLKSKEAEKRRILDQSCVDVQDREGENEEEGDLVPGTPPSKKFKSLFFGMSQSSTQNSETSRPAGPILAEDTDED